MLYVVVVRVAITYVQWCKVYVRVVCVVVVAARVNLIIVVIDYTQ